MVDRKRNKAGNAPTVSLPVTEDSLAAVFAEEFEKKAKFEFNANQWYLWDGFRWKRNKQRLALERVRQMVRSYAVHEGTEKAAKEYGRASFLRAVEYLARSDVRMAISGEQFDCDPLLLATPGGTVELVTGELREAYSSDLISRSTAVAPSDQTPHRWLEFLHEATGGDDEIIKYLQVMAGYCLTGEITEQCLFFLYGPGGNGKTVFMNTVCDILGDYAISAPMQAFTATRTERHETELAMMQGARLVRATETEEGQAWAEARIKSLTGGDPLTARFMRQDFFTFRPVFKLVVVGNHKPALRNVDKAMARRMRLLPWLIQPANPNKRLELELRQEWGGILQWMIDGCLEWLERDGFPASAAIAQATSDYIADQDLIAQFIETCCAGNQTSAGSLHGSLVRLLFRGFSVFCEHRKESPGSEKRFSMDLEKRGYSKQKTPAGMKIIGLWLNEAAAQTVGGQVNDGL